MTSKLFKCRNAVSCANVRQETSHCIAEQHTNVDEQHVRTRHVDVLLKLKIQVLYLQISMQNQLQKH